MKGWKDSPYAAPVPRSKQQRHVPTTVEPAQRGQRAQTPNGRSCATSVDRVNKQINEFEARLKQANAAVFGENQVWCRC